jgi:acyl carrier protein
MTTSTDETAILHQLRGIFREGLGLDPLTSIEPETRFFADLGLASIDAVVLGEEIQSHFGKALPYDRLMAEIGARSQRDLTIDELIQFLKRHL